MKKTIFILFIPFLIIFTTVSLSKQYNPSYDNKHNKSQIETINVTLSNSTNFTVEVDKINKNIDIVKGHSKDCKNYINIDVEKTTAALYNLDKNKDYTTTDYINIFNTIKPYIDTNMSYMYLFSLYDTIQEVELGSINLL